MDWYHVCFSSGDGIRNNMTCAVVWTYGHAAEHGQLTDMRASAMDQDTARGHLTRRPSRR